jgi:uncharacterized damage-inducible protein DinB
MEGLTPEFAVMFRDLLAQGLALEVTVTKKVLAAIPSDQRDYRPHPTSRSVWELAWHIAADVWFLEGISDGRFEVNADLSHPNPARDPIELAEWYENRFVAALAKVCAMTPAQLLTELALGDVAAKGGLRFPAVLYLLFLEKHTVHHRGQLSAYLRPIGGKVPRVYGPSADEP